MNKHYFIDVHAIQTVPPSCVNRDDTGSPKTAVYGGTERARVSSQAWKHAMREYFKEIYPQEKIGIRTKFVSDMVAKLIMGICPEMDEKKATSIAYDAMIKAGLKKDKNNKKKEENEETNNSEEDTNAEVFFVTKAQIMALAKLAVDGAKDKKMYETAMKDNPSIDIILFGRMVANNANLNYDAASQVAHAISTHAVSTEYDYFTTLDDEQPEDKPGAAYLATVEFNSATLYRYATLNISEMFENLGGDTPNVVKGFVEAFVRSMPTGKQNTFANRTLPDMLYVTVRADQPVNLSGAFEKAIKNGKEGYAEKSCETLLKYADEMYNTFADEPEVAFGCGKCEILPEYAKVLPLKELLSDLETCVAELCGKAEE